jgi:hypothetical protein
MIRRFLHNQPATDERMIALGSEPLNRRSARRTPSRSFQVGRIGLTPDAIAVYYRGSDRGDVMAFPKTFGQLLEVTHAHAFTMALVLLVLAHLFVSTGVSSRAKGTAVALAFGGTIGGLVTPWAVRYVSGTFAFLGLLGWLAQAAGIWTMLVVSGYECLGRGRAQPGRR